MSLDAMTRCFMAAHLFLVRFIRSSKVQLDLDGVRKELVDLKEASATNEFVNAVRDRIEEVRFDVPVPISCLRQFQRSQSQKKWEISWMMHDT